MTDKRCSWAESHPILQKYHDTEWGIPVHNDQKHFEFLVLDGFQAGLSWLTILKKRENFNNAFSNFDFEKVSKYSQKDVERLLNNEGIIRNKLKIEATICNAQHFIKTIEEFGSFDAFIWSFTNNQTVVNNWNSYKNAPTKTEVSDKMSKTLIKRGFKFVGSTICYAYMQAAGMVNDHETSCFRYHLCQY
jgi:DNA-3-methyladenine glycosylase I